MINMWGLFDTFQIWKINQSPFEKDIGSHSYPNHLVDGCEENTSTTFNQVLDNTIISL
jgi:hypothetical protein